MRGCSRTGCGSTGGSGDRWRLALRMLLSLVCGEVVVVVEGAGASRVVALEWLVLGVLWTTRAGKEEARPCKVGHVESQRPLLKHILQQEIVCTDMN